MSLIGSVQVPHACVSVVRRWVGGGRRSQAGPASGPNSFLYCKLRPHDTMDECLREIGDLQEMIANILQRNEPDSFKTITADELLAQTFKKPATISDLRIEIKVAEQVDTQVRSKLPVIPQFHLHVIFACAS